VRSEAADGLAFLLKKRQPRMLFDRLLQLLHFPVDALLPQGRIECSMINEYINILRKPLDQAPAFGQAGTAFENDPLARRLLQNAECLGDEIILLNDRFMEAPGAEMLRCPDYGLVKIGVLE
jgi:hypothetical protein